MDSWSETFFDGSLPEKRLRARAVEIGDAMEKRPGVAMTGAFDDAKDVRNAYNFFENERISMGVILDPARRALAEKLRALPQDETVLAIQDTTELNLSAHPAMRDVGTLGNPINHGIFLHPVLAVGTSGAVLGLLGAQTWVRPAEERGKSKERRARHFEEKESVRWWKTIEHSEALVHRAELLLHVGDAEADIYELFWRAQENGRRFLIRATSNRSVQGADGEHAYLWDYARAFAQCDEQRIVDVRASPATKDKPYRPARQAKITVGYGKVTLCSPVNGKESRNRAPVQVFAVWVREQNPPADAEPLEWLLLTSDPIITVEDAWLRVDWYKLRWTIEEYNKVLKSGLCAQKQQYESRATYENWLAMALLVAVRLMEMNRQARVEPRKPASTVLSDDEQDVLLAHAATLRRRPAAPLTMADAINLIAKLGGYLDRACDGPPGFIVLWRGYTRLSAMVVGYRLAISQCRARSP